MKVNFQILIGRRAEARRGVKMKRRLAILTAAMMLTVFCGSFVHAAEAGDVEVPKSAVPKSEDTKSGNMISEGNKSLPSGIGSGETGREIEAFVEEHKDTMAGMAVSVFEKDNILYEGYFGFTDREAGIAVDENSVFEWGSATKTLVWVSVMQQVEQGKLDLTADVRKYLPEGFLTNSNPSYSTPVTMLDLMNHTAGYQELLVDLFVKDRKDIHSLGEQLKLHEPVQIYEPGTITAYSNWGVTLAAYLVECVSGQEFCEYVHQNIFAPLGMEHSALAADLSDNSWVSDKRGELQCYTADGTLIPDCFYYISLYPAGMCTSTLGDMRLWAEALAVRDERLLSADTWSEFYEPTSLFTGTTVARNCHGLWTELRSSLIVGHGGNTAGCSSYILVEPESGLGAVVMTNQQNEAVFNDHMMDLIFGASDRTLYFDRTENPAGVYRTARTILAGPLKIYSAGFTGDFADDDSQPWHYVEDAPGGTLVQFAYTDYIKVSSSTMILEVVLLFGALAAAALAAVVLTAKLICGIMLTQKNKVPASDFMRAEAHGNSGIISKLRKKAAHVSWQAVSCVSVLLTAGLFCYVAVQVLSYAVYESYRWGFYGIALLMTLMIVLFVYGVFGTIKLFKGKSAIKSRILNILVLLILFFILAFMGYFQLWRIWII